MKPGEPQGIKVLVVDDSAAVRASIVQILTQASLGLELLEAPDGAAALTLALGAGAQAHVDLVLADVMMPHLDGMQLLRALRHRHDAEALPVILLSSHSAPGSRALSFDAGANDYLHKPFSPAELIARVQVQLRSRALLAEVREANARCQALALRDPLTGLLGRRAFLDQGRRELARARRHRLELAVAALDVDNFRRINARVGYAAADGALAEIGRHIEQNVRTEDVVGRLTGARFLALLPEASAEQARGVIDRLRTLTEGQAFAGLDRRLTLLSAGLASFPDPDGRLTSIEALVDAAEAALDRAKGLGGNRVTPWMGAAAPG